MIDLLIKTLIFLLSIIDSTVKTDEKLVKSYLLEGILVKSETGWSPAAYIHMTRPFDIWEIETESGKTMKCADEHIVFAGKNMIPVWVSDLETGSEINTADGIEKIVRTKKHNHSVCMCDITVLNERESYYTNGILSHNTTTSGIFLLHYILFNVDKNSLVLGNKRKTAVEILDKAKKIFMELPYFLKPGIYNWNEGKIVLDNGCMCMAEATTINSGISFTFHCVLADEFAHIHPNILDKFYNNLFPTITAGKARFIISSTQNGYNLFYRLWCGSVNGENEYAHFKVDWWQVPEWNPDKQCFEKRDEKWHQLQIANYGGEENFNRQFGTGFDISGNSLISTKKLNTLATKLVEYKNLQLYTRGEDFFFWNPNCGVTPESLRKEYTIITIDISEGGGGDYTFAPINVLRKDGKETVFLCVGYYCCNTFNYKWSAHTIREFCMRYLTDQTRYMISVELNLYGELFVEYMKNIIDENLMTIQFFNEDCFVKYYNDSMTKYEIGARITPSSKSRFCNLFKNHIEEDKIVCPSTRFHNELTNFCDHNGNGQYKATFGHDDFVMAEIQLEAVMKTVQFKNFEEEYNTYCVSLIESATRQNMSMRNFDMYSMSGEMSQSMSIREIYNRMGFAVEGYSNPRNGQYNAEDNFFEMYEEVDPNLRRLR